MKKFGYSANVKREPRLTPIDTQYCRNSISQGREKMGVGEFINDSRTILKLATKPSRKELWMSTKVSLLAMVLVGMVSFIIQIIMTLLTGSWGVY